MRALCFRCDEKDYSKATDVNGHWRGALRLPKCTVRIYNEATAATDEWGKITITIIVFPLSASSLFRRVHPAIARKHQRTTEGNSLEGPEGEQPDQAITDGGGLGEDRLPANRHTI